MNEGLKKVDAVVRYVTESRPNLRTVETDNRKIAKRLWWDYLDGYPWGDPPHLIDITVNGETFTEKELSV